MFKMKSIKTIDYYRILVIILLLLMSFFEFYHIVNKTYTVNRLVFFLGSICAVAFFINTFLFYKRHRVTERLTVLLIILDLLLERLVSQRSHFIFIINSILIIVLILKKNIFEPSLDDISTSGMDIENFVFINGENPLSYLTLEDDKKIYVTNNMKGLCGYQIIDDIFIVCGDIICRERDGEEVLKDILSYTNSKELKIIFVNTTDKFKSLYENKKLIKVNYGEDSIIDVNDWSLSGNKVAKVRAAINHAIKAGLLVKEYRPLINKDDDIESQFNKITNEWLNDKGGIMLQFTVGTMSLNNPQRRRYFYSEINGEVQGFIVYDPYDNGNSYLADITRRKEGSIQGALEIVLYESINILKKEGIKEINLGLSPLFDIIQSNPNFYEKILNEVYEKMNGFYDFKSLHHAKEKYNPSIIKMRYLMIEKGVNPVSLGKALIQVQYPNNFWKIIYESIKKN